MRHQDKKDQEYEQQMALLQDQNVQGPPFRGPHLNPPLQEVDFLIDKQRHAKNNVVYITCIYFQ